MASAAKKSTLRWVMVCIAIITVAVGGYFGYDKYQGYLANKVYAVGDTVSTPDFTIKVTTADYKPVDLPLDTDAIKKYGNLTANENCNAQPQDKTWWKAWNNDPKAPWVQLGPSEYNICNRRNASRDAISKYMSENKKLSVDYTISAKTNVSTKDLHVDLVADSGRELGSQVDELNANQFFSNCAQHVEPQLESILHAPGPVMTTECDHEPYKPYVKSNFGGDITTGIERKGSIHTDIRNTETTVDLKVTYQSHTRLIRIHQ